MTTVIAPPGPQSTDATLRLHGDWRLDAVRPADRDALAALFDRCSPESIASRFFGQIHAFPRRYLDEVLAGRPQLHDALVARHRDGGHLGGLASLAAGSEFGPDVAELSVLVADEWQQQGLGAAMVGLLLERARARGVERVTASVLPERSGLLAALGSLPMRGHYRSRECTTALYALT